MSSSTLHKQHTKADENMKVSSHWMNLCLTFLETSVCDRCVLRHTKKNLKHNSAETIQDWLKDMDVCFARVEPATSQRRQEALM